MCLIIKEFIEGQILLFSRRGRSSNLDRAEVKISNMENIELTKMIGSAFDEALKRRGIVNILIAGKTGVGKSTLINSVFQGNFASTGQGKPVTTCTRQIKKRGIPLSIYDTRGLEMEDF